MNPPGVCVQWGSRSHLPVAAVGGAACTAAGSGRRAAAAGGWSMAAGPADSNHPRSAAAADCTENPSEDTRDTSRLSVTRTERRRQVTGTVGGATHLFSFTRDLKQERNREIQRPTDP